MNHIEDAFISIVDDRTEELTKEYEERCLEISNYACGLEERVELLESCLSDLAAFVKEEFYEKWSKERSVQGIEKLKMGGIRGSDKNFEGR